MIELVEVTKFYKERMVLNVPYLSFDEGKRYALIGVNGCGKTTLLRIMAGAITPDSGQVLNIPIEETGYMPQSPYAFGFSVLENVNIASKNSDNAEPAVLNAIEAVGIQELSQARGNKLSGGETQRMAFARMIVLPRKLLLLDEPTSAADIRGIDQIEKALLDYAKSTRCTVIFSTHSPAQALRLANEVVFLDEGCVVEKGLADDVLRSPKIDCTKFFLQHWKI